MSKKPKKAETICRVACRHKPYSQLGNAMMRDKRMSLEALGVLCYILSFPSNWKFSVEWLCKERALGRDKSRKLINEHILLGYCARSRTRNEDGTLGPFEYVFTDEPQHLASPGPEYPGPGFTGAGQPVTGKPGPGFSGATHKKVLRTKKNIQKPLTPSEPAEAPKSEVGLQSEPAAPPTEPAPPPPVPTSVRAIQARRASFTIKPTDVQWKAWIGHLETSDRDDLACEAREAGQLVTRTLWPPAAGAR